MASVNKVILIGRLGRDPEMKYLPSGTPVVNFSLATTERASSKDGGQRPERTEWHNIVAYSKLAELINQYLKKGRAAYIEGRIQTRSWDDRDGNKKSRTEIVANNVQFLDSRDSGSSSSTQSAPPVEAYNQVEESLGAAAPGAAADDDLPF